MPRSPGFEPDTAIGGPHGRFPSTRVSLVDTARSGLAAEALERVIAVYWKPVYRFIRLKFGKGNEDAKDLTQAFFVSALERQLFAKFDPAQASFRTYLRMAVERFAANAHEAEHRLKRGGDVRFEPLDEEMAGGASPEQAFDREWRRQVFSLAVADLRAHCEGQGRERQWQLFEAYDLAAEARPSYADLAAAHGIPVTTVTNHLAWARRMLRGFVAERVSGITAGDAELREEMRGLWI